MFYIHFVLFYAFSGTNLLTRCHSASSLFSAVFGFRKVLKEIFSELDDFFSEVSFSSGTFQKAEHETKWATEAAPPRARAAAPLAARGPGVGPSGRHRLRPFAYKYPPD